MSSRDPEARIIDLEILLTHQQRDLAELSRQLIEQRQLIDALQRRLARLESEQSSRASEQRQFASHDDLDDEGILPDERIGE